MVPVSYETLKSSGDIEPFAIWDKDGNEYQGEYTQFRVSGDSIPEGYHLYGMRHGDDDMIPCTIEPYVVVNYYGAFITKSEIPLIGKPGNQYLQIEDWSFAM